MKSKKLEEIIHLSSLSVPELGILVLNEEQLENVYGGATVICPDTDRSRDDFNCKNSNCNNNCNNNC